MTSLHKPEQDDIKNVSPGKLQLNGYPTAREESTLFIYQVQWGFVDCIAIRSRKYIIFDIISASSIIHHQRLLINRASCLREQETTSYTKKKA